MTKALEVTLPNFSDAEAKLRELSDLFNIDHGPVDEFTGKVVVWMKPGGLLNDLVQHLQVQLVPFKEFTLEAASVEEPHEGTVEEREAWFEKRTDAHVARVQKYAKILESVVPGVVEAAKDHDDSKYEEPQRTPYIALTWQHKWDDYKGYKTPGNIPDKAINEATLLHIKGEEHHPEHWTDQTDKDLLNSEDRDGNPKEVVDATKMPDVAIAEMIADWAAMSEELGQGSPRGWADKKVNVRWKFTPSQVELIYKLISTIEENKSNE